MEANIFFIKYFTLLFVYSNIEKFKNILRRNKWSVKKLLIVEIIIYLYWNNIKKSQNGHGKLLITLYIMYYFRKVSSVIVQYISTIITSFLKKIKNLGMYWSVSADTIDDMPISRLESADTARLQAIRHRLETNYIGSVYRHAPPWYGYDSVLTDTSNYDHRLS